MNKPKTDDNGLNILMLCKCGSNISNAIDFDRIRNWAKKKNEVDIVLRGNLLCSPKTKTTLARLLKGDNKFIQNKKINSLVIAACSPKQHEKTFREIAESVGINIGKVLMANIREQCAWITKDKEEATDKAISLINAVLKRSHMAEELDKPVMKVLTSVLVIGGGITGIQTALTLARADRKVYLVEKNISLGGAVIKTEEVAPNMECAPCLMAPLLSQVRDNSNIEVFANSEVEEVLGFFGNFSVKINQKARYVEESCIACEECFEVCPVSVKSEFQEELGERKAIHTLFAGAVPAAAAIDKGSCIRFKGEECSACQEVCPFQSVNFEDSDKSVNVDVGSIVIATGFEHPKPDILSSLGYKTIDNVLTLYEFERLAGSNGPSDGEVLLKNGNPPSSVVLIHCAGSLCEQGIPYCSGVCCMNAIKAGEMLRKKYPGISITNIHNDLVFKNPKEYRFFEEQKEEGTAFIKCADLSSLNITQEEDGSIYVNADGMYSVSTDMVILSTGMVAPADTEALAAKLNVDLDENRFYKPDHQLLHNTGAVLDGIYIAGCASGPQNIPESITQGHAAAGDILSKLIPGREIELEICTAIIDGDKCSGCKLCITVCPYKAITFDKEKKISMVNEAICRGCGTCTAACPGGASTAKHFRDNQIYAEVGGLLNE